MRRPEQEISTMARSLSPASIEHSVHQREPIRCQRAQSPGPADSCLPPPNLIPAGPGRRDMSAAIAASASWSAGAEWSPPSAAGRDPAEPTFRPGSVRRVAVTAVRNYDCRRESRQHLDAGIWHILGHGRSSASRPTCLWADVTVAKRRLALFRRPPLKDRRLNGPTSSSLLPGPAPNAEKPTRISRAVSAKGGHIRP